MNNYLHYLQQLSYIHNNPAVSGIALAKTVMCTNNIIDNILESNDILASGSPESLDPTDLKRYVGDVTISTIDSFSTFFMDKRTEAEVLKKGMKIYNDVYNSTKEELESKALYNKLLADTETEDQDYSDDVVYSTAAYGPADCFTQSGLLTCDQPIVISVQHDDTNFTINTRSQLSGVFVPNLDINIVKGTPAEFRVNSPGHPLKIFGYSGVIADGIDTGTFTFTIPKSSDIQALRYGCALALPHCGGVKASGHRKDEGGNIFVKDGLTTQIVSFRPEYIIPASGHSYIDSKYWDPDKEIPCKYGGIKEIKALTNRPVNCLDLSHFLYEASGLFGYQQYFPTLPEVYDAFSFRETSPKVPFFMVPPPDNEKSYFIRTSRLEELNNQRFHLHVGSTPETDKDDGKPLTVYDSLGDMNYGTLSTRWPAERVNVYLNDFYYAIPGLHTAPWDFEEEGIFKPVHITDEYNGVVCNSIAESYRNISLVDIRANFYSVRPTTFENNYGTLQMNYGHTMRTCFDNKRHSTGFGTVRMHLDANFDPIFDVDVKERAMDLGLKTYDGYMCAYTLENREWDSNAGHAYIKTIFDLTQKGPGDLKIIDIDELGRNDVEFGAIGWFMGSQVEVPGKYKAPGGIVMNDQPNYRCPGLNPYAPPDTPIPTVFTNCVGNLELAFPGCSASTPNNSHNSNLMMFRVDDGPDATEVLNNIEVGMIIQGPFIPDGAVVVEVSANGIDGCGPYIRMNLFISDVRTLYPPSAEFSDTRYFNYTFFKPKTLTPTDSLTIQYPLRCNKAVLYAYAVYDPIFGPITVFLAFEYYEAWLEIPVSGGQRTIYPRYKIDPVQPTQFYNKAGWTPSRWNREYRPVSLNAVEAKRAETCHQVASNLTGEVMRVSRVGCRGLYPYYDFNIITCTTNPLHPCYGYDFNDPCGACFAENDIAYVERPSRDVAFGSGPCLAEDILDYDGNTFYNGFDQTLTGFGLYGGGFGPATRIADPPFSTAESVSEDSASTVGVTNIGHEVNFPVGDADDPHVRGGSAGGALINSEDFAGNPIQIFEERSRPGPGGDLGQDGIRTYDATISPDNPGVVSAVRDIIQNNQMTRMPKTVGGFAIDFSQYFVTHPDASEIDAPVSNNPFYIYTSDGFVTLTLILAGEVGVIEHRYLHPPVNYMGEYGGRLPWDDEDEYVLGNYTTVGSNWVNGVFGPPGGSVMGDLDEGFELFWRPLTEAEKATEEVCHTEIVPLTIGSIKATTILNNLHINVAQNHAPQSGCPLNSWPSTWTPKTMIQNVNYTTPTGVLVPPSGDTRLENRLALVHQDNTKTFFEIENYTKGNIVGLASNLFDNTQNDGRVLKEAKVYHVNHNIGVFGTAGPYNDCGSNTSNYYCYKAPEKVLNDGEEISKFPGPRSVDRYFLGDPYEDYQSIWANRRCCHNFEGCACSDGEYDAFGFGKQWSNSHAGDSLDGAGHIVSFNSEAVAKRYGYTHNAFIGFKLLIDNNKADARHNPDEICGTVVGSEYIDDEAGFFPHFGAGITNGGAWTLDNPQYLNGSNLGLIDCCFLPASSKCPVFYYEYGIERFFQWGSYTAGIYNWNTDNVDALGRTLYRWKGTVNGEEVDVTTMSSIGSFSDSDVNGEAQVYVNKRNDGKHSIFARAFVIGQYIIPRILFEGDEVCNQIYSRPNFEDPSIPQPELCYTVEDIDMQYDNRTTPPTNCGFNPNIADPASNGLIQVPAGYVVTEEWSDWVEITCDQAGNTFSFGAGGDGFVSSALKIKGDCFLSFLFEGLGNNSEFITGNERPVNSNCIMGPKRIYP